MQEKHLYEYAVIRVVPLVEREEFVNAGIILFSKRQKFITVRFALPEEKLRMLCKDTDIEQVKKNLQSFEKIALGKKDGGPIAAMDIAERFRWLTAVRSSVIQTSRPHPGLCNDLEGTVNRLFEELVM
jgi:hypothetical protein